MARYTVFMYFPADAPVPDEGHDAYGTALSEEGVMVFGSELEDSVASTSIRADGLVDGPYLETKEVIVGFYVIDVPDLDAAIAVARRNPIIPQGGGVEVRPTPDADTSGAQPAG